MSTIKFNQWLNPDNTENYKCRAWANFNGSGTVAIRASGNVSSITDNAVGDYTVNLTTAMPDVNYIVVAIARNTSVATYVIHQAENNAAGTFNLTVKQEASGLVDAAYVSFVVFR